MKFMLAVAWCFGLVAGVAVVFLAVLLITACIEGFTRAPEPLVSLALWALGVAVSAGGVAALAGFAAVTWDEVDTLRVELQTARDAREKAEAGVKQLQTTSDSTKANPKPKPKPKPRKRSAKK